MNNPRVGIYIRVSTREQSLEGYSIPAQKSRLKAYCQAQGWTNYKFYIDAGISAKDMNRDDLQRMLSDVKKGKINMILVFRLDRFTRSVRDLYEMLDMLDKHGCAFKSATEMYDTSSAMGRMFIGLVALLAQWERENIGERVIVALDERASDLKAIGKPPYGYMIKDEYYVMSDDNEVQKTVRKMIEMALNGDGINTIARWLNDRSVPTPSNTSLWYASTVYRILTNPALYGVYYYKGNYHEDAFEGYIDKETFDLIQDKLEDRATDYIRGVSDDAVFHRVLSCPECGHALSPAVYYSKVTKDKLGYSYKCRACRDKRNYHKSYNESKMIDAVVDYMKDIAFNPAPPVDNADKEDKFEELKNQIDRIERQRLKYQRAWSTELMTDEEFEKLMKESNATLIELNEELKVIPKEKKIDYAELKEFAWAFNETFRGLTPIEQRTFISRFVRRIEFEVISEIVPNRKRPRDTFRVRDIVFYT